MPLNVFILPYTSCPGFNKIYLYLSRATRGSLLVFAMKPGEITVNYVRCKNAWKTEDQLKTSTLVKTFENG